MRARLQVQVCVSMRVQVCRSVSSCVSVQASMCARTLNLCIFMGVCARRMCVRACVCYVRACVCYVRAFN